MYSVSAISMPDEKFPEKGKDGEEDFNSAIHLKTWYYIPLPTGHMMEGRCEGGTHSSAPAALSATCT
jgi:hypothetical protein